jgi:putative spermidine/putrescine transport system substrate-binding protein
MSNSTKSPANGEVKAMSMTRRRLLQASAGLGVAAGLGGLTRPLRAAGEEMVIGCTGGHIGWLEKTVVPLFQERYDCTLILEGTKSTVNLEKMRSNADAPYLSVVMMDDPVLILAAEEELISPLSTEQHPILVSSSRRLSTWTACGPTISSPGAALPSIPAR